MRGSSLDPTEPAWHRLYVRTGRVDLFLSQCYTAGLCLALIFLLVPSPLSRIGAVVLLVALAYMLTKVHAAYSRTPDHSQTRLADALAADLNRLQARLEIAACPFFNLPFLVGANLVFMGLPTASNPVHEAALDCVFLASTVLLFTACFLANQLLLRGLLATSRSRQP